MLDKECIAESFSTAAIRYDAHATIQRHVARQLVQRILLRWPRLYHILEIGCGTGSLTEHLLHAYPEANLLATDIAPAMIEACQKRLGTRAQYAIHDGEFQREWPGFDLTASSLAFQWFTHQEAALQHLANQTPRLAISTLLDGTFLEWKAVHSRLGLADGVRNFIQEETLREVTSQIGASCEIEVVQEEYPDALQFVRALKAIGAATPRIGHHPVPLRRILREFPDGITITYRVAYILTERWSLITVMGDFQNCIYRCR